MFSFATAEGRVADILRTRVVPVLIPKIIQFEMARAGEMARADVAFAEVAAARMVPRRRHE